MLLDRLSIILAIAFICTCKDKDITSKEEESIKIVKPEILFTIPFDEITFVQGFCSKDSLFYISSGLYGSSSIRVIDSAGKTVLSVKMPKDYFAEGCVTAFDKVYQLTWQEKRCFVYSLTTLDLIDTFFYSGEGWGITFDGEHLIMSNGSDTLYYRNKEFAIVKKVPVLYNNKPLSQLNELEYSNGYVYANVWHSDYIFEINPKNGNVERILDCEEIVKIESPQTPEDVLNGIAYSEKKNLFYLTGKNWKNIYAVRIPAK